MQILGLARATSVLTTVLLAGCQTRPPVARPSSVDVRTALRIETALDERGQDTGQTTLVWAQLLDRCDGAHVIVIGEEHDDANGHAVQLALVEDLFDRQGGGTLAMEMLERDEQGLVDDYADGIIKQADFIRLTESGSWSGEGSWVAWYQPIIDAALQRSGRVVAANAPRRYVRLARRDGWAALDRLPPDRSDLVSHPPEGIDGLYRQRFFELMTPEDSDESHGFDVEVIERVFDAQQVWDATMAESVAEAVRSNGPPVVLLIGRFHSDFTGGTVYELQRRLPDQTIFTISLETGRGEPLDAEQGQRRADVVVYTRTDQATASD